MTGTDAFSHLFPVTAGEESSMIRLVMRDFANDSRARLGGRYDITVFCINRLTLQSNGEFTGSLEFTSPATNEALGLAKPTGEPPPPLELGADGPAQAPSTDSQPAQAARMRKRRLL